MTVWRQFKLIITFEAPKGEFFSEKDFLEKYNGNVTFGVKTENNCLFPGKNPELIARWPLRKLEGEGSVLWNGLPGIHGSERSRPCQRPRSPTGDVIFLGIVSFCQESFQWKVSLEFF